MKNKCIKILSSLILSIIMLNYIGSTVLATSAAGGGTTSAPSPLSAEARQEQTYIEQASKALSENFGGTIIDGIVGVMTILFRLQAMLLGFALQALTTLTANSAGTMENGKVVNLVTPDQILFNRIAITDINFFQTDRFGTNNQGILSGANNPIKAIRQSIASWYYALRTISIIILLCILIYIGIRMAVSTVAEEKAVYKKWLWNWLVSMALLFVLHYFIIIVITLNNSLVDMLFNVKNNSTVLNSGGGIFMDGYVENLIANSVYSSASALGAWSYTLVYLGIVIFTLVLLIMYIKRMITIAFLILISPIITITYSVDKLKDNSAQALNEWMKQFCQAIIIQPFHCIIYMVFISTGVACISRFGTLAAGVLTIMCMIFLFTSEKIVKEIFGINKETAGNGIATVAAVGLLLNKSKSIARKCRKGKKYSIKCK